MQGHSFSIYQNIVRVVQSLGCAQHIPSTYQRTLCCGDLNKSLVVIHSQAENNIVFMWESVDEPVGGTRQMI